MPNLEPLRSIIDKYGIISLDEFDSALANIKPDDDPIAVLCRAGLINDRQAEMLNKRLGVEVAMQEPQEEEILEITPEDMLIDDEEELEELEEIDPREFQPRPRRRREPESRTTRRKRRPGRAPVPELVEEVPELEPLPDEDELSGKSFGEILRAFKLVHTDDIEDAVEEQERLTSLNRHVHIGALLLDKGLITASEIIKILQIQGKNVLKCNTCGLIASKEPGRTIERLTCPKCLGRLVLTPKGINADLALQVLDLDSEPENPLLGMGYKDFKIKKVYSIDLLSTTFIGEQESLERKVGIRVLNEDLSMDPAHADNFLACSRNSARLSFHSISAAIDIGKIDDLPCYIFDFPEGHSSEDYVALKGKLPVESAARVAMEVAYALKFCQDKGVFHGNINPLQVFISTGFSVNVINLGFQHSVEIAHRIEVPVCNPAFYAPEVIRGQQPDHASDQYAIGALLYYLLTGIVPASGSTWLDTAASVLELEPAPASAIIEKMPGGLESTLVKMMQKTPSDRFVSMDEMLNALAPYAGMKHEIPIEVPDAETPVPMRGTRRQRRPRRRR